MFPGHSSTRALTVPDWGSWSPLLISALVAGVVAGTVGCHDLSGLTGKQQLPAGTPDPRSFHTPAGALALYESTVTAFQASQGVTTASIGGGTTGTNAGVFVNFVFESGLLTDELQPGDLGCTGSVCLLSQVDSIDARQLPEGATGNSASFEWYSELQALRNQATLGIGALAAYDPTASPALRGHLYALAGYADLMLADLFCSGVPLSTLNFNGTTSFTYAPGSTTLQVYSAAVANFDTAIALSNDSVRILNFARIGKGRALLALDSFPQAAAAVAAVPDGFAYQFPVDWGHAGSGAVGTLFANSQIVGYTEADEEGLNGLPYRTSGDPRTAAQISSHNEYGVSQFVPVKYGGAHPSLGPVTVADWIEARLIRAEAALQAKDYTSWLAQLNTLRETAMVPGQTTTLADTSDPGASPGDSARVSLLFHERAYWLYLTGHRQGDLRRLLRQYKTIYRSAAQVYPFGQYPGSNILSYGSYVNLPIPASELTNPLYHGCLSRGA